MSKALASSLTHRWLAAATAILGTVTVLVAVLPSTASGGTIKGGPSPATNLVLTLTPPAVSSLGQASAVYTNSQINALLSTVVRTLSTSTDIPTGSPPSIAVGVVTTTPFAPGAVQNADAMMNLFSGASTLASEASYIVEVGLWGAAAVGVSHAMLPIPPTPLDLLSAEYTPVFTAISQQENTDLQTLLCWSTSSQAPPENNAEFYVAPGQALVIDVGGLAIPSGSTVDLSADLASSSYGFVAPGLANVPALSAGTGTCAGATGGSGVDMAEVAPITAAATFGGSGAIRSFSATMGVTLQAVDSSGNPVTACDGLWYKYMNWAYKLFGSGESCVTTIPTSSAIAGSANRRAPAEARRPPTLTPLSPTTQSGSAGTWSNISSSVGTPPSARSGAGMAYDQADGYLVLFGGSNAGDSLSDTWVLQGGQWRQLQPTVSPPARTGASMAYAAADGYVLLFGGYGCGGVCGDTWAFKAGQWSQLQSAASPSPRAVAAMTYDSEAGEIVLFGGTGAPQNTYDGDTWTFKDGSWSEITPSQAPSARAGASMVDDPGTASVILFGGTTDFHSSGAGLSGTWAFAGGQWTRASATGPVDRDSYSLAYDPATQSVVMFGGWNPSGACGSALGDTWQFSSRTWSQLSQASGPEARQGAAATYDPSIGSIVLFGGVAGSCDTPSTYFADTWKL